MMQAVLLILKLLQDLRRVHISEALLGRILNSNYHRAKQRVIHLMNLVSGTVDQSKLFLTDVMYIAVNLDSSRPLDRMQAHRDTIEFPWVYLRAT